MAGHAVRRIYARAVERSPFDGTGELEAPGQVGRAAEDLGVEKVAAADETACDTACDGQAVEHPHRVEAVLAAILVGIIDDAEHDGKDSSVAGKAALPYLENLDGMSQVEFRLIEEAVAQAGAHYGADEQDVQQRLEQLDVDVLPFVEFIEQPVAQREAGYEEQRIETQRIVADREDGRIDVPNYREKICHRLYVLTKVTHIS